MRAAAVRGPAIVCPSGFASNAYFPQTGAGDTASGVCNSQYAGAPTRTCSTTGTWSAVQNPCTLVIADCPQEFNYLSATWQQTPAGTIAQGVCLNGFASASVPTRQCFEFPANGSSLWSTTVANPCQFGTSEVYTARSCVRARHARQA